MLGSCPRGLELKSVLGPWGGRNKGVLHIERTERTAGWQRQNLRKRRQSALLAHIRGSHAGVGVERT